MELKKNLLSTVASRLTEHGFGKRIRGQSVWKPIEGGRASFHLSFIDRGGELDVTADVAIRFDALEDLVNSGNERLSKSEKNDTYSLGAELGNLRDGKQRRWEVKAAHEVDRVASSIVDMYLEVAKPYIDRFSQMEAAFEVLSRDDKKGWDHCPVHDARAERAVGLAKLLGKRNEEIQALIAQKDKFLEERNDFGLDDFRAFVQRLK